MNKRLSTWLIGTSAALILCGSFNALAADKIPDPTVLITDKGAVRGVIRDGVREFKGIPFAKPPVGELRWAPPEPAAPWSGILDATAYKSICPQPQRYDLKESSDNEDCLHLNVTAPYNGKAKVANKPVIVWVHGGAFVGGSNSLYNLNYMAKSGDVVVVSMNYRLGVFGVMAHPDFAADSNGGYGLLDQRAALRWVKDNIATFGGDPNNVTLAGESAGGAGVCMHVLAPEQTTGLFHKAIIQSAGCVTPLPDIKDAEKVGNRVAKLVGCKEGAEGLACMRQTHVKDLLTAGTTVAGNDILTFMPNIGTPTVPLPGAQAIPAGKFVKVPMLIGGTKDELRLYVAYAMQAGQKIGADNYADLLKETYGDNAAAIAKQYPVSNYSSAASALGSVWSDFRKDVGINHCIYLETAKLLRKSVPIYQFIFSDQNAPPVTTNPGFEMGAVHSSELPYMFPHYDNTSQIAGPDLAPASQKLADQMMAYFTSFARTGKPKAPASPVWEPFTADNKVMNFEPGKVGYFDAAKAANCSFWKGLYPTVLTQ